MNNDWNTGCSSCFAAIAVLILVFSFLLITGAAAGRGQIIGLLVIVAAFAASYIWALFRARR